MSLPKRDGVQGRYYLIQKPDTNPEVLEHADQCIQDVLDGAGWEERAFRFGSERPPDSRNGFLLQFHPTHPGCTDLRVSALRGPYPVYGSGNNGHLRRHVSVNS